LWLSLSNFINFWVSQSIIPVPAESHYCYSVQCNVGGWWCCSGCCCCCCCILKQFSGWSREPWENVLRKNSRTSVLSDKFYNWTVRWTNCRGSQLSLKIDCRPYEQPLKFIKKANCGLRWTK
jgi:hypothetical protein